jgi:aldose 1-epimerase
VIGTRTVDGFEGLRLASDDGLEATFVPRVGMVGCSLRDRGAELLGQRRGLGAYFGEGSTMGIPFLYPWANRLSRDRIEIGGREVDLTDPKLRVKRDEHGMAIHGLLTAAAGWRVTEHRATDSGGALAARFEFDPAAPPGSAFPFPHEVLYEAQLADRTLTIALTVEPTGDVAVPIAFGFHPYLRLPRLPRSEWNLEAPVERLLVLDERGVPTGEREPAQIGAGPLGERTFDDAFEAPPGAAPFVVSGGGRRIELSFLSGYPDVQIYAPTGDALIAIEPMTAPTDALARGDEVPMAEPGDPFTARFSIAVQADP